MTWPWSRSQRTSTTPLLKGSCSPRCSGPSDSTSPMPWLPMSPKVWTSGPWRGNILVPSPSGTSPAGRARRGSGNNYVTRSIRVESIAIQRKGRHQYATGMTTLAERAGWLNSKGFRTRNMHRTLNADGELVSGPRLFTTASVRVILHNAFFAGLVKHRDQVLPGIHDPLVSKEVFDLVQTTMRKNSGRSETLNTRPQRQYLLKGIIRCAYCRMPMWAQTYQNGKRYYREHRATRGLEECPAHGGSIPCEVADEQVGSLVEAIILERDWLDRALVQIQMKDEVDRIGERRGQLEGRKRRLGRAYVDGHYADIEYRRQMKAIDHEMESLVVPEASAAEAAGYLIERLPELWREATLEERRRLLLTMLEAVYVDAKDERRIVAIRPKPPFMPVFMTASTSEESWMELTHEPSGVAPEAHADSCSWWRRGGVEPPVQKTPRWNVLQAYPALYFSPSHRSAGEIVIRPADSSLAATIGVRACRTPITWRLFPVLGARRGQT